MIKSEVTIPSSISARYPNTWSLMKVSALIIVIFVLPLLIAAKANAENVYISVRETQLRAKADFLSKGQFLRYGDMLTIIKDISPWLNVKTYSGLSGYVHKSAVTKRQVLLNSNSNFNSLNASHGDVVLAGKGFSKDVENQLATQNTSLNFSAVDMMQKPRVAPNDLAAFISSGKLNGAAND